MASSEILGAIDADLDLHGQRKKALRVADAQWNDAQRQRLPEIDLPPITAVQPESLLLEVGRPRTPAYVVYLFLAGRQSPLPHGRSRTNKATASPPRPSTVAGSLHIWCAEKARSKK